MTEQQEQYLKELRQLLEDAVDFPEIFLSGKDYFVDSRGSYVSFHEVLKVHEKMRNTLSRAKIYEKSMGD